MVLKIRLREVFLLIILFPVMIPIIITAVQLTAQMPEGNRLSDAGKWLGLLAAYDVIYLVNRSMKWDIVADAAAEIGVLFSTLVLITGSI